MRPFFLMLLLLMTNQSASAAGYLLKQGKGYAICEAFKKQLDKLGSLKEPLNDTNQITWEIPGVKQADWQELDIETHKKLFDKIVRYYTWNEAPWNQGNETEKQRASEQNIARWSEGYRAGKVKLQVLRVNIELYDETPETIARIWRKYGDKPYEYFVIMYPMTDDLKEIDEIKKSRAAWMFYGDIVVYGDRHYVVAWNTGSWVSIESDFNSGLVPFCTIEFDWKAHQREINK